MHPRWDIELFFKWIKQHLRIKAFFGTSENAVKAQIWSAVCVYVLVAIIKQRLRIKASLYEILQILSLYRLDDTCRHAYFMIAEMPAAQALLTRCERH